MNSEALLVTVLGIRFDSAYTLEIRMYYTLFVQIKETVGYSLDLCPNDVSEDTCSELDVAMYRFNKISFRLTFHKS